MPGVSEEIAIAVIRCRPGGREFVTHADLHAETAAVETLARLAPDHRSRTAVVFNPARPALEDAGVSRAPRQTVETNGAASRALPHVVALLSCLARPSPPARRT